MPYPSLTFAQLLDNATRAELEQFASLLQGYLAEQHNDDGSHSDLTAETVEVSGETDLNGAVTINATLTVNGDAAFTEPVTITASDELPLSVTRTGTAGGTAVALFESPNAAGAASFRAASGAGVQLIWTTAAATISWLITAVATVYEWLDVVGNQIFILRAGTTAKGGFFPNGYNLTVGIDVYPGRGGGGAANPTNSIAIYEGTVPAGTLTNGLHIYAKDVAGVTTLAYMKSDGTEVVLNTGT